MGPPLIFALRTGAVSGYMVMVTIPSTQVARFEKAFGDKKLNQVTGMTGMQLLGQLEDSNLQARLTSQGMADLLNELRWLSSSHPTGVWSVRYQTARAA